MIPVPAGLAALVQDHLKRYPFSGQTFVFRGRQGRLIKILEKGRFLWPVTEAGTAAALTTAQVAMLLEGIDWRTPVRSDQPRLAG